MSFDAQTAFKEVMMGNEKAELLFKEAESQFRKENFARALLLCTETLQHAHEHTEALYIRAKAKFELGNIAGAVMDLTAILSIDPEHILASIKRSEYAFSMHIADEAVLLEKFPAYYQQFQNHDRSAEFYSLHNLPADARRFVSDALHIYEQRAWQAEKQHNWENAIHYWQLYHDCGGQFDGSSEDVIHHINHLKQRPDK